MLDDAGRLTIQPQDAPITSQSPAAAPSSIAGDSSTVPDAACIVPAVLPLRAGRRKRAALARQYDRRLRLLIESVEDYAIFMLDTSGLIASWNPGAARLKGYCGEEIIGRHFACFYAPEQQLAHKPDEELRTAARTGRFAEEGWRVRKDGSRFWAGVVISAMRDDEGTVVGYAKITRDFTERLRAEQQLAAANAAANDILAKKNEEAEAFVYIVSHDLRAPLVNIQGFSSELMLSCDALEQALVGASLLPAVEKTVLDIVQQDIPVALRYISASTAKFQRLIDTLLLLSRTGKQDLTIEEVDVRALVDTTMLSLRQAIRSSGAAVIVEPLPTIQGDVTAIGQVFSNLLSNALKYLQPNRPGRIVIGGESTAAINHYWIQDNGAGIPASAQPRLFQVFQRFHPQLAGGDGMGLAIVKRIIDRHGGKIWADSVEGVGTTFHLQLPAGTRSPRNGGVPGTR